MRAMLFAIAFLAGASGIFAQEKPVPPLEGVKLRLELTPEKEGTDQMLRGIFKNETKEAIEVPSTYDGHTIQLSTATLGTRFEMRLWRRERIELATVKVAPGEEHVLFEMSLPDMIAGKLGGRTPNSYGWDWSARPAPPASPFHSRDGATHREAKFWFLLRRGDKSASSPQITVKWQERFSVVEGK